MLEDLAALMPESVKNSSAEVLTAWDDNWIDLGKTDTSVTAIDDSIDTLRNEILEAISRLD